MKKKAVIIASSALIAGGVAVAGYNVLSDQEVEKQTNYTVSVKKDDIQVNITANGVVEPTTVENIVPSQNGKIKENFLKDGKAVKKGDLLVSFEGEDVGQQLAQQEASLEKLKIDLVTMQQSLIDNNKKLNVYTPINGTVQEILVEVGDLIQAGQSVAIVNVNGEMKEINAKTSGKISTLNVNVGDWVENGKKVVGLASTGDIENQIKKQNLDIESTQKAIEDLMVNQTAPTPIYAPYDGEIAVANDTAAGSEISINSVLGTITNFSQFKLVIPVDELDIPKVKVGQVVNISANAYPGEAFTGKVLKIASQGTSTNGVSTFNVEVSIDDPKQLMAGMTATATIQVSKKQDTLLVPVEAVKEERGKKYVTVEDGNGTKDIQVTTGLNNENYIEILTGLTEGKEVILPLTSSKNATMLFGGTKGSKKAGNMELNSKN